MTDFVLDASVAVSWAFEDETGHTSHAARQMLATGTAVVPALFGFELANSLSVAVRRHRLTVGDARTFLGIIEAMNLRSAPQSGRSIELFELANHTGLTAYDAAYLLVSQTTGLSLATNDAALRKAAKRAGVPLV